jgi:ABC-type oligopeptide transport system substrate-binding subunit
VLERWEPGEVIELRSADTWWEGKPALRSIQAKLGSSASQPFNLYQAGEIDLLPDLPAELVDLARDPASGVSIGTLEETTVFATSYIALGNASEPLDDLHIRRALQRAFPATRIADAMLDGNAVVATGVVPPGMLGEEWRAEVPRVDLDAAREEIANSRYGSGESVPPISIYAADIGAVEALRDVARASLGLDVEAIQVGWSDYMTGLAAGEFAAYGLYWGADYPDPESMIGMLFESGSSDNYTGYSNEDLDALLAEARSVGGPERVELLRRANQILIDDAAVIPLYHPRGYTLARPGIGGIEVTPMGILGLETIHAVDA